MTNIDQIEDLLDILLGETRYVIELERDIQTADGNTGYLTERLEKYKTDSDRAKGALLYAIRQLAKERDEANLTVRTLENQRSEIQSY